MCGQSAFQPLAQLHFPHKMTQLMQMMFPKHDSVNAEDVCKTFQGSDMLCSCALPTCEMEVTHLMYNVTPLVLSSLVQILGFSLN